MFHFIFWCPLYENHPLKMNVLELNEMLVQHGAAEQQQGKWGFQITKLQECDTDVKTNNLFPGA